MNIGVWTIDWRAGNRAVTTSLEHPGGTGALYNLRDRLGMELAFVDVGAGAEPDAVLAAFDAAIDERTRLVAISHVLWATGAVMPSPGSQRWPTPGARSWSWMAPRAPGAIPFEVAATGADVYAISAQKWLLGPEGWARRRHAGRRDRLRPASAGISATRRPTRTASAVRWPDARRFESANYHRPSIVGMARSIGWLSMFVGLDWIYERGHGDGPLGGRSPGGHRWRRDGHTA